MQRKITRNIQKGKARHNFIENKAVNRFSGNAARLEHSNVRNKNKGKKN